MGCAQGEDQGGDEDGRARQQELESADALSAAQREQSAAGDTDVGQRAEAQGDGGAAVVVDAGADRGEHDQQDAGDGGEDAGQAVHVVQRIGGPGDEREQRGQYAPADEARGPGQVAAPQPVLLGDGGGDRLGDVVEDRRRQGLRERAQGEEFAVEDALGGEGAGAVQHGAVGADEVVADRGARRGALLGQPEDLRIEVGDRDVVGQCHVDAAVRRDDGDPAEAESGAGAGRGSRPGSAGGGGRHAHLLLPLSGGGASMS